MAKAKKKTPKEASSLFHQIMKASVQGNPKPKESKQKPLSKKESVKKFAQIIADLLFKEIDEKGQGVIPGPG